MTAVPTMPAVPAPAPVAAGRRASSSFWHAAWYRYRQNRLALVAGVVAIFILLTGALAPLIAPYSEASNDLSATHGRSPASIIGWGPTSWGGTR